jgi:hypothetical protein
MMQAYFSHFWRLTSKVKVLTDLGLVRAALCFVLGASRCILTWWTGMMTE